MLARAKILNQELEEASKILENCLAIDPSCAQGYLLMARLYYEQDEVNTSLKILEQGMSRDFAIRNHPLETVSKFCKVSTFVALTYPPVLRQLG